MPWGKTAQRHQEKGDSVEENLLPMGAVTTVDMKLYTEVDDKLVAVAVGKEAEHENVFQQYSKASRIRFEHVALIYSEVSQLNGLRHEQYASSLVEARLVYGGLLDNQLLVDR